MRKKNKVIAFVLILTLTIQMILPGYASGVSGEKVSKSAAVENKEISEGKAESTSQTTQVEVGTTASQEEKTTEKTESSNKKTKKEAQVQSYTGEEITTIGELSAALTNSGGISYGSVSGGQINISNPNAFIILSHTEPSIYCEKTLYLNYNGTGMNLVDSFDKGDFQGLGSVEKPFCGALTGDGWSVTIDHALFNGLSTAATFPSGFSLIWKGVCDPDDVMLASSVTGSEAATWNITVDAASVNSEAEIILPALIGDVKVTASDPLSVGVTYGSTSGIKVTTASRTHASLLCNTLTSGNVAVTALNNLPSSVSVKAEGGYAGGLVGEMQSGTGLSIASEITFPAGMIIEGTAGAGGLIGTAEGATLTISNAVISLNGTITGTSANNSVGGVIGFAKNIPAPVVTGDTSNISIGSDVNIKGMNVGGMIGKYEVSPAEDTIWNSISSGGFLVNGAKLNCDTASGNAGGLFGVLLLGDATTAKKVTIQGGVSVTSILSGAQTDTNYGGLIGKVEGRSTETLSSVTIGETTSAVTTNVTVSDGVTPLYTGGLVGNASNSYLSVTKAEVRNAEETSVKVLFGGAVGNVDASSVLEIHSLTVSGNYKAGGGVAGTVGAGAAVSLNGTLDMTGAIPSGDRAAQLIGEQKNGLIYATEDVNFLRCPACRYNDIGNYGEVIRLGAGTEMAPKLDENLITIEGTSHKIILKSSILDSVSESLITLANVNQFALLAIMIQTNGAFSSAGTTTRDVLLTKNITLNADINLTGTGLIGFMQDSNDGGEYKGTFDGGGHIITLAIGEAWGERNGTSGIASGAGSGQIYAKSYTEGTTTAYYHTRVGLFSNVNGATVKNITLEGNCAIGADQGAGELRFGALAAVTKGTFTVGAASAASVDVTTNVAVFADGAKTAFIGGLLGEISEDTVSFSHTAGNAKLTNTGTGIELRFGGLIGRLTAGTVNVSAGTTLGGKISTGAATAKVGAFLADTPDDATIRTININELTIDGQQITAKATGECGGLLGYEWDNTDVTFGGTEAAETGLVVQSTETEEDKKTKLENAPTTGKASSFGGLVYRANGYWKVNKLELQKASFSATRTNAGGLLVCHGDAKSGRALYLELTSSNAYLITSSVVVSMSGGDNLYFDELVTYTADSGKNIVNNGCGIISIATGSEADGTREGIEINGTEIDGTVCNTYQNQTTNSGTAWAVNPNSRYYYNLDAYRTSTNNESALSAGGEVDTTEKLLLWSVGRYAASNLQSYFGGYDISKTYKITGSSLNLTGYSYYPVKLSQEDKVSIGGATITFANAEIQTAESSTASPLDAVQRLTSGSLSSTHSQHYLMHCGLFYDYTYSASTNPTSSTTYKLSVKNTTFSGSVGMTNGTDTSGALLCGNMEGKSGTNCYVTMAVDLSGVTLENLYIHKMTNQTSYAPLLMNTFGSYTAISVSSVTADTKTTNTGTVNETGPNYAATSLIGKVGGADKINMAISFDKIKLEGKKNNSIFKNATLLESFQYDANTANSSGTYNFNLEEDWPANDTGESHEPFNATYGWEIFNSVENQNKQYWYYDKQVQNEEIYVNPSSYPTSTKPGETTFNSYLPYVANSVATSTATTPNANYHELKVNIPVADLIRGCGTYSDPYVITSETELAAVADFLATGNAGSGWKINMDEDIKNDSCDKTNGHFQYQAGASGWTKVSAPTTIVASANVREYLRNAYYQIGDAANLTVTLGESFKGLGTKTSAQVEAFRGVIIGYRSEESEDKTSRTKIFISEDSPATGLINYSYGSVVKDLDIEYQGESRIVSSEGFGGVINHLMGGDNIIDDVCVSQASDFNISIDSTDTKSYLRWIGGYVGIVEGGGVIFRNMTDDAGWSNLTTNNEANFYQNPFVGRVLDGFAFYEKGTGSAAALENTDKNYKIATLDTSDTGSIATEFTDGGTYPESKQKYGKVTVKSSQGLLLLSAIASSGAGAGGCNFIDEKSNYTGTLAYYGASDEAYGSYGNRLYGKTRNASYDDIGKDTSDDITLAMQDDTCTPCPPNTRGCTKNTPYLVSNYTDSTGYTMLVSATYTRFDLVLQNNENEYEYEYNMTGYGNGYRGIGGRYKSNAIGLTSANTYNADRYTPYILDIDCKNSILIVQQEVKEYSDDTYPAMAVGGFMPFLQQDNQKPEKLPAGVTVNANKIIKDLTVRGMVSLKYYKYNNGNAAQTNIEKTNVGVGGVFGRSANRSGNRDQNFCSGLSNIKLEDLTVDAPTYAGGLFGAIGINGEYASKNVTHTQGKDNIFAVSLTNCTYKNLSVTSEKYAGGFIGYSGANGSSAIQTNVGTNTIKVTNDASSKVGSKDSTDSTKTSIIKVEGSAGFAGGLIGYSEIGLEVASEVASPVTLDGVDVQATGTDSYSGAIVGRELGDAKYADWNRSVSMDNIAIQNCTIDQTTGTTGGTVGGLLGSVEAVGTTVTNSEVSNNTITGTKSGGLLGELLGAAGTLKGSNLLWKDNTITGSTTTAGNWVGVGTGRTIQLAGVSRQATTNAAKAAVLANDIGDTAYSDETTSYIAYADYTGQNNGGRTARTVNNTFGEIPVAEESYGNIELSVGEFVRLPGINYSNDSGVVSITTQAKSTVVKAEKEGSVILGGYMINVTKSTEYESISLSYPTTPQTSLSQTYTAPYFFKGYVNAGGNLNVGSNGAYGLVMKVDGNIDYKISFDANKTPDKKTDNGIRFRVAYYTNLPVNTSASIYNSDETKYYYMSKYDKDYSTYNKVDVAGKIYASYNSYKTDRYTDSDTYTIGTENTIQFPNDGYAIIVFNNPKGVNGSDGSEDFATVSEKIKVEKQDVVSNAEIEKIYLQDGGGLKTGYLIGAALDVTQLKVIGKIKDKNAYLDLDASKYTVALGEGETMATAGIKTVKVTLNSSSSIEATYQIAVNHPADLQECAINVVTSPKADTEIGYSTVPTLKEANATTTALYGDGAIWDSNNKLMLEKIQLDGTASPSLYTNQQGTNESAFSTENLSTFQNSNLKNTTAISGLASTTIPVLKVVGGSDATGMLKKYLDVVTNGGYSHAVAQKAVTASSKTYKWETDEFTATSNTPSLTVSGSGTEGISYQTGSRYDNDQVQLTVLAVTFSAGTNPDYTVYVPIVVERILEVDFIATFQNGTVFYPDSYNSEELQSGVRESHGNAITAYLTYRYNSKQKESTPYGWQTYMDGGGDVSQPFEKTLTFGQNFPANTEFLLVDCQNNDKMYQYKATGPVNQISLTSFSDFTSKSIGELMGAVATSGESGKYVKTTGNDATVTIGSQSYRLATSSDPENSTHYTITLDESLSPTENYYLVIRTPQNASSDVIGAIGTEITCTMPKNINYAMRNGNAVSGETESERTFGIYSGYGQTLAENATSEYIPVPATERYEIPIDLNDTISYGSGSRRTSDMLYQKFQVNLEKHAKDNGNTTTTSIGFPSGASGTVTFSLSNSAGNTYYYYVTDSNDSAGSWIETNTKIEPTDVNQVSGNYKICRIGTNTWEDGTASITITPLSYEWRSDGGVMNLIVGTANATEGAVSLSPVRDRCGTAFKVNVSMDVQLSALQVVTAIPSGQIENNVPTQYAKLKYTSQLSSTAGSLSYSIQNKNLEGKKGYYVDAEGNAVLTYEATDVTQLGINLGDSDEAEKKQQEINTWAIYNLSGVKSSELGEKLASATAIRFTMTIERRGNENRGKYATVGSEEPSLWKEVRFGDPGNLGSESDKNTWTYDLKDENGLAKEGEDYKYYDSQTKTFTVPITFAVNTTLRGMANVENYFANYHAKLEVSLVKGSGTSEVIELDATDYITYTITSIKPEFIIPQTK